MLSRLVAGLVDAWLIEGDAAITEITLDLDEVRPGVLFIARRQWWGDTHLQLEAAVARGAAALVVSRADAVQPHWALPVVLIEAEDPALAHLSARFYGHPTRDLRVIGVTGTNGKTSTVLLVEHLLRAQGERPARMGTTGYAFGGQHVAASNTTPDALVIQRFAHDALARGATALVLEVSSHALSIGRVAAVAFDAAGFTMLGRDHLDFHGDLPAYRAAKARLFTEGLAEGRRWGKATRAVAWVDDANGAMVLAVAEGQRVGVGRRAGRLLVRDEHPDGLRGERFSLDGTPAWLPWVGAHNVQNAAVAVALVARDAAEHAAACAALADAPPPPGRLEPVGDRVWVDYAHTPDAVRRVIAEVRVRTRAPINVVLGCGGDRDRGKRPLMAAAACDADGVWLTADNPRSEPAAQILAEMRPGLSKPAHEVPHRLTALAEALAAPGVTLVLGKGHEAVQVVGAHTWAFDDRVEARRILRAQAERVPLAEAPFAWGWANPDPRTVLRYAMAREQGVQVAISPQSARWLDLPPAEAALRATPWHDGVVLPAGWIDALHQPPQRLPALRPRR
jgi:UDP-N-acetylmuramoyl-L-alanyl-D-glutamate--2,6-diaminopimelate ligase